MTQTQPALVDFKLTIGYLAEQPIIHTEETIGNISKLKRMRVIHDGQPKFVPALSGNSFRGQLRDILADQLCMRLSDNGAQRLTLTDNAVYGILYSGGALGEGSNAPKLLKPFLDSIPSIRLMGAAFGNIMLPSKIAATHIVPCAKETSVILKSMHDVLGESLPAIEQWTEARNLVFNDGPLTRKDDARDMTRQRFVDLERGKTTPNAGDEEKIRSQMIYYVECIPAGTWLLQQIYTKLPVDALELGAFFDGLSSFLKQPALGGRSAAGYGQVRVVMQGMIGNESISYPGSWPVYITQSIKDYEEHIRNNKADVLNALTATPSETKS